MWSELIAVALCVFALLVVVIQAYGNHKTVVALLKQLDDATTAGYYGIGQVAKLIKAKDVKEVVQANTQERHSEDAPSLAGGLSDEQEAVLERELEIQRVKDPHFNGPPPRNFRHPQFMGEFTNAPIPLEEEAF